jgi:ribosomal protein L16/L10AE
MKATSNARVTARQIEAARRAITRHLRFAMARERLPGDLRAVITGLDALPSQIG